MARRVRGRGARSAGCGDGAGRPWGRFARRGLLLFRRRGWGFGCGFLLLALRFRLFESFEALARDLEMTLLLFGRHRRRRCCSSFGVGIDLLAATTRERENERRNHDQSAADRQQDGRRPGLVHGDRVYEIVVGLLPMRGTCHGVNLI